MNAKQTTTMGLFDLPNDNNRMSCLKFRGYWIAIVVNAIEKLIVISLHDYVWDNGRSMNSLFVKSELTSPQAELNQIHG